MDSSRPLKLVTVNNAPERAKRVVGRVIESLRDKYNIVHSANAESPKAARSVFEKVVPDMVFTASMWTPEQSRKVLSEAREINSNVKALAIPQGLQVNRGPDAVVEYLLEQVPKLLQN